MRQRTMRPRPPRISTGLALESLERRDLLSVTRILLDSGFAITTITQIVETRYVDPNEIGDVACQGADIGAVVVAMPPEAPVPDGVFVLADLPGIEVDSSQGVTSAGLADVEQTAGSLLGGLNIVINAGATLAGNQAALDAFHRAADQWEAIFADPITVTISADLVNLGSGNIIGQASSVLVTAGYNTVRNRLISDADSDDAIVSSLPTSGQFTATLPPGFGLTGSLSGTKASFKAAGFTGLDGQYGAVDATIQFNTLFSFDFDNSNGVNPGTIDFETVAAHEIGHALGFVSSVDTIDAYLNAGLTTNITPTVLDLFRFANNVTGQDPSNSSQFTTYPRFLNTGGNPIFDDTIDEWRLSTGVYTGDGRQASHWKDNNLTGTLIGIMDPTLAYGQVVPISAADIRALDLIGWDYVAPPNQPPVLDPIGDKSISEGSLLTFVVTASDPNSGDSLTYSLGPGTPAGASMHPTSGWFTWTPTDSFAAPPAVTVIVTDNGTPVMSDSETILITVLNVAPTAGVSGPSSGVRGEPRTFALTAADPSPADQAAGFAFSIDWDGDGTVDETIVGPSGAFVEHVFDASGVYTVKVTATDKDGGVSDIADHVVEVADWALRPNEGNPSLTDLVWGGTAGDDQWIFIGDGTTVRVGNFLGGEQTFVYGVTGRLFVHGQTGNDLVLLQGVNGATVDGGAGDDGIAILSGGGSFSLAGGSGADSLFVLGATSAQILLSGGDGDDHLHIMGGEDVQATLLGGDGADALVVNDGADLSLDIQGEGDDDIVLLFGGDYLSAVVDGGDGNDLIFNATGYPTTLRGGAGDDILVGGWGADVLEGGDGDDLLLGGDGNDSIAGDAGNDVIVGFTGADSLSGGLGEDLVLAGILDNVYFGDEEVPGVIQVWNQWRTGDPIGTRKAYLTGTPGGVIDPEYAMAAGTTVLNDGDVDVVLGDADNDWLLFDFFEDSSDYAVGVDLATDLS